MKASSHARSLARLTAGWERVVGWLGTYLSAPQPAGRAGSHFLLRLLPPRPSFMTDMRPDEAAAMQQHVEYWKEQLRRRVAIAFGPVADPQGGWGLGIVEVAGCRGNWLHCRGATPAIKSGIGLRYEALPILRLMLREPT